MAELEATSQVATDEVCQGCCCGQSCDTSAEECAGQSCC